MYKSPNINTPASKTIKNVWKLQNDKIYATDEEPLEKGTTEDIFKATSKTSSGHNGFAGEFWESI